MNIARLFSYTTQIEDERDRLAKESEQLRILLDNALTRTERIEQASRQEVESLKASLESLREQHKEDRQEWRADKEYFMECFARRHGLPSKTQAAAIETDAETTTNPETKDTRKIVEQMRRTGPVAKSRQEAEDAYFASIKADDERAERAVELHKPSASPE